MASEMTRPSTMACAAECDAASGSFSPIRRATVAVAAIEIPMAMAKRMANMDSVTPTVATARSPTFETQNMSTTAKSDSIAISRIMGMASSTMARGMEPAV